MRLTPEARQALAGEYVLGTLRGAARRRFEALMRADAGLAALVQGWEEKLTPLAETVAPVEPPARVWQAIESRIGTAPAPATEKQAATAPRPRATDGRQSARGESFWSSLAFWRSFGLVSGGLATVLLATFIWLSTGPRGEPVFVAVLQDANATDNVRTVISMHSPDLLRVRNVKAWNEASGRSLELWVLPAQGAPRSLGVVGNAVGDTMINITAADPRVQGAHALALSMEPPGGSPTGKPTGPVVAKGIIAPVKRT